MATKYVDPVNGNDSNNGQGPDASHASNKPWKTIAKALGASGISSGDTVYLAPGTYREVVTVTMTIATAETSVVGDPLNLQGFKTSGGARVDQGPVIWTAYTTNDTTAPTSGFLVLNQRNYLTFRNIEFIGGAGYACDANGATQHITFRDCAFFMFNSTTVMFYLATNFNVPYHWLIERCYFYGSGGSTMIQLIAPNSATGSGDYDIDFVVRDSIFIANWDVFYFWGTNNPNTYKPGGVVVRNCTFVGGLGACGFHGNWSTSIISTVKNCLFYGRSGVACDNAGEVTEDYNIYVNSSGPPRGANVTQGGNSVVGSRSIPFSMGQERIWGGQPRPFGEPQIGSKVLGFGNDGTQQATDLRGAGHIRPAGGASALPGAGALERVGTFGKEVTTVRTGTSALSATGPAVQEFLVPVDVTSNTISVYVRWDSTYAGTKPQLQIDAAPGVSAQTVTATGSVNNWEQLTLSAFSPTVVTMVRIRVISNDTNGGGKCFVDDFAVA